MNINGEKLKHGDWIVTSTKDIAKVILIEEVYDQVKIVYGAGKISKIRSSDIESIHEFKNSFEEGLELNSLEDKMKADKQLDINGIEKPKMSLIPQLALVEVAKVFGYGANKYTEYNFSKGSDKTVYTDAALRHINSYLLNKDLDEESGLSHLAHAISNLMMLLDNDLNKASIDNRNKSYK